MPSIGVLSPRLISFEGRRSTSCISSPFSPLSDGFVRRSSSYHKLPHQLFKLSILKLDGSSFDVQIEKNATVGELKQAVEDVFIVSPKENDGNISWSHVWGHFCLCYEGQKLLNDTDYIQSFLIQDGDELHFIRHLSINYDLKKRRSKSLGTGSRQHNLIMSSSDINEGKELKEMRSKRVSVSSDVYEVNDFCCEDWDENPVAQSDFKLANFLKGWLSYSKLCFVGRSRASSKVRPSRYSGRFIRMGTKFRLTRF